MAVRPQTFPMASLRGSAYDIGYQHGSTFRPLIRDNVRLYLDVFAHYARLDKEEVFTRARMFIPIIERFDKEILEEIHGIAEGSGSTLDEIVALNCRTEIMFKEPSAVVGGCTAMAVSPEVTESGHTLIGQNWDWIEKLQANSVILRIAQKAKPAILTFTEAGFVGKSGLNSAGLGLCVNLLLTERVGVGMPFHVMIRGILNSTSLGEAIGKIINNEHGASANYLIAHAGGEALDIEASPDGAEYLYNREGTLAHANHFESKISVCDLGRRILPDSILRSGRAGRLLAGRGGPVTLELLQSILQDHFNYPNSICRHPDDRLPELERLQTNASMVMDLNDRVMMACVSNPCLGSYTPIPLEG